MVNKNAYAILKLLPKSEVNYLIFKHIICFALKADFFFKFKNKWRAFPPFFYADLVL